MPFALRSKEMELLSVMRIYNSLQERGGVSAIVFQGSMLPFLSLYLIGNLA